MWTQFDELGVAVVEHSTERRLEQNGGASVLPPVRSTGVVAVQKLAGDRGVQRKRGGFR